MIVSDDVSFLSGFISAVFACDPISARFEVPNQSCVFGFVFRMHVAADSGCSVMYVDCVCVCLPLLIQMLEWHSSVG